MRDERGSLRKERGIDTCTMRVLTLCYLDRQQPRSNSSGAVHAPRCCALVLSFFALCNRPARPLLTHSLLRLRQEECVCVARRRPRDFSRGFGLPPGARQRMRHLVEPRGLVAALDHTALGPLLAVQCLGPARHVLGSGARGTDLAPRGVRLAWMAPLTDRRRTPNEYGTGRRSAVSDARRSGQAHLCRPISTGAFTPSRPPWRACLCICCAAVRAHPHLNHEPVERHARRHPEVVLRLE